MTEYELDQMCQKVTCDGNCMKCPIMAEYIYRED
jgi:hypothetical protein